MGPYEIVEQLGQGGMATIYRARHRGAGSFQRDVVVKAMLPNLSRIPSLVEMFEAEARFTAQLRHPNIVQVEHYGVDDDGTPYLIMELLDGKNLSQLRSLLHKAQRRMPVAVAVRIAYDLCAALGCAHDFIGADGQRMQIIHRDVSPSNVMVQRDGSVKLLDFGVAKLSSAAGQAITSSLKGKFAYMSPEQVRQRPIDRRCDVFAAGIVLHEMLTGRRLFGSKSELETLRRVAAAEVIPPSKSNTGVSPALDAIVMRALSLRPADRFDSGDAMAEALASLGPLAGRRELATFVEEYAPIGPDLQREVDRALRSVPNSAPLEVDTQNDAQNEVEPTNTRRGHLRLLSSQGTSDTSTSSLEIEIIDEEVTDPSLPSGFDQSVSLVPIIEFPKAPAQPGEKPLYHKARELDLKPVWEELDIPAADPEPVADLRPKRSGLALALLVVVLVATMIAIAIVIGTRGTQPLIDAPPPPAQNVATVVPIVLPPVAAAQHVEDDSLVGLNRHDEHNDVRHDDAITPTQHPTQQISVLAVPNKPVAKPHPRPESTHKSVKDGAIVDPFAAD